MNQKTAIAIHGGAGTIAPHLLTPQLEIDYRSGLKVALEAGNKVLKSGGTATEAVLAAVVELENNPLFNAGKGGVFNHLGQHEMDAAIMDGQFLKAGAVCGVKNIKNPVLLAHAVMTKSPHVMMAGDGAEAFAKTVNIEFADNAYFHTEHRYQQWLDIKGTLKTIS
jgi:L-asparaginase / beta-aspartyl-peptidase